MGVAFVSQIEASINQWDTFRDARQQSLREWFEIICRLNPRQRCGHLSFHPTLNLAFARRALQGSQRSADLADFVPAIEIQNGLIQLSVGEIPYAALQRRQFVHHFGLDDVESNGPGSNEAKANH